jgi:hypothetical protein
LLSPDGVSIPASDFSTHGVLPGSARDGLIDTCVVFIPKALSESASCARPVALANRIWFAVEVRSA